jgi:transposase
MRTFKPYNILQNYLLPPNVDDWLSEDHPARFIATLVEEKLDLSRIRHAYQSKFGRGAPAYNPAMMLTLLIYGYSFGVRSSRKLESATYDDLALRFLMANQHPDHDSIAHFYRRFKSEFDALFLRVLHLCADAGLIKLGDIDLYVDGTKILAGASRHQTVTYTKIRKTEQQLQETIASILAQVDQQEAAEDQEAADREAAGEVPLNFKDPNKLRDLMERLDRVAKAREEMERSARAEAEREVQIAQAKHDEHQKMKKRGRKPIVPDVDDLAKKLCEEKRINLVDPDSRLMIDGATKAIVQAYNSQAVAAGGSQIIIACNVTSQENDQHQLAPMAQMTDKNLELIGADKESARRLGADAGYLTVAGVSDQRVASFDLYIAPGRSTGEADDQSDGEPPVSRAEPIKGIQWYTGPPPPTPTPAAQLREEMRAKIASSEGKEFYNHRSNGIESVFAEIKETRGFRRFLHRGIENVQAEWTMVCLGHNIRKLFASQRPKPPAKQRTGDRPNRRKCVSTAVIDVQMAMQIA